MTITDKYDKVFVGLAGGLVLPFVIGTIIFLSSSGDLSLTAYLSRLSTSNIITHSITICVFPNVFIFLIFNRYDMLRASRGVLAMTIIWALIVFAVKFFL